MGSVPAVVLRPFVRLGGSCASGCAECDRHSAADKTHLLIHPSCGFETSTAGRAECNDLRKRVSPASHRCGRPETGSLLLLGKEAREAEITSPECRPSPRTPTPTGATA